MRRQAVGVGCLGYFKPNVAILREELVLAKADLAKLQGDRSAIGRVFTL